MSWSFSLMIKEQKTDHKTSDGDSTSNSIEFIVEELAKSTFHLMSIIGSPAWHNKMT